ncbi:MAG: monovalent cation/H(+) antiporter subunit G [Rhodospirillales bacterium]|nr:monovalent cation/H(+) antiporter subunit G [Rhodospirillales bacterium]MCW8861467.1 monovalent cation/H(+) antiporter subunit G [Rhodospirillales bacterium]MCW8970894.1 monovalent cation/H(+) antiporter subunit G [Rhodospirillales bacterium]MCW9003287.1 monovalent cation/H(+) antiporter subunit G [Rhodospirillales bacterium]
MTTTLLDVISWAFLLIGGASVIIGTLGILRLPDVYTRMHAASITDTLGAGMIVAGLAIQGGFSLVSAKLFLIFVFLLFTSPVSTHALAKAALTAGVTPAGTDRKSGKGAEAP